MATTVVTGVQYSGIWNISSQANAKAAGTWPSPPPIYSLYGWGYNFFGNLGLGNTTYYSSPKQIGALTNWSALSVGQQYTLAVKTDGTLWAWGRNPSGQLGDGTTTNRSSPVQIGALTNWSKVCAGRSGESFAIKTDGTLWSWGTNARGQLGLGNTTYYSSPKQIGALTSWASLSTNGVDECCGAVKTDGTLWVWGRNSAGELGLGNRTYYSSPKQLGALTNWSKIQMSNSISFAIKTDGTLWSWGSGGSGQLGLGNTTYYSSPKQVGSLTNWSTISASYFGPFSIKTDGTLWGWGNGTVGRLGLNNRTSYSSPKQIGALTTWALSNAGDSVSLAVKTDGTLWMWGDNSNGALGLGNTTNYSSPKQVGSSTNWLRASTGGLFTIALG